ncbi:MAG: transcription-repair coupling factor, partial [Gammaproteobacteria bacterium]|nr:transcription-repair coupling factor [Gammaproteobacteria bacterium]
MTDLRSPFAPDYSNKPGYRDKWGHLYGSGFGLVIQQAAARHPGPVVVLADDTNTAQRLEEELGFYLAGLDIPLITFPDWETLPYDIFSPHQDIISDRLSTLYQLPRLHKGVMIAPVQTLMHRTVPQSYLDQHCLHLDVGQQLNLDEMRTRLDNSGYRCVSSVMEHGEFAVRGSLLDLFPMGSRQPFRIELFDDEIESIRTFDPETQRSLEKIERIRMLPAREFPLHKEAVTRFRQAWRARFEGDPNNSTVYREVSNSNAVPGIEYYLALFFDQLQSLFSYLPDNSLLITLSGIEHAAETFRTEIEERYEQHRYNIDRPILPPNEIFLQVNELFTDLKRFARIELQHFAFEESSAVNFDTSAPPHLTLDVRAEEPAAALLA